MTHWHFLVHTILVRDKLKPEMLSICFSIGDGAEEAEYRPLPGEPNGGNETESKETNRTEVRKFRSLFPIVNWSRTEYYCNPGSCSGECPLEGSGASCYCLGCHTCIGNRKGSKFNLI